VNNIFIFETVALPTIQIKNNLVPTRIAIFDDSTRIRNSLQMLLDGMHGFIVTGVFENTSSLAAKLLQSEPNIILMDIDMPGMNGIDSVKEVRSLRPDATVIMQTVFDDEDRIFQSLQAGAHGYLTKDTPPLKIVQAIEEALNGGSPMTPGIARKVTSYFKQLATPNDEYNLSIREKEILQFLCNGLSYKMIAAQLNIAYETVHSHIRRIYQKLQVNSIGEAIAIAFRKKLIQ
jgi:DNA-binding NarL/FixJ family response regulator